MPPTIKAIPLIVVGVLLNAGAQIALKKGLQAAGGLDLHLGALVKVLLQPWVLAGLACYAVSVVVWLGARPGVLSRMTDLVGDLSYGVYLFGWPVTLLVAAWSDSVSPLVVFALSALPVFLLAWTMHRLVEIPVARAIKPWVLRRLPRFSDGPADGAPAARAARFAAWLLCLATCVRFVVFPLPLGANWFAWMWPSLAGLCVVIALMLKAGNGMSYNPRD